MGAVSFGVVPGLDLVETIGLAGVQRPNSGCLMQFIVLDLPVMLPAVTMGQQKADQDLQLQQPGFRNILTASLIGSWWP